MYQSSRIVMYQNLTRIVRSGHTTPILCHSCNIMVTRIDKHLHQKHGLDPSSEEFRKTKRTEKVCNLHVKPFLNKM